MRDCFCAANAEKKLKEIVSKEERVSMALA